MIHTFFRISDGRIIGRYRGSNVEKQLAVCGDGVGCIEGEFDGTHIIDGVAQTIVSDPPFDLAAAREAAIVRINAMAGSVIVARLPDWKQRNLTARAVELLYASATGIDEWLEIQSQWDWVKAVRAASNAACADIEFCNDQGEIDGALEIYRIRLENLR